MASTLKFENVAPPSSGSVVSAPSTANTVATPRCPFTANCCVKFAAPLVSVIVPAASSSNLLKSRVFSGKLETSVPESVSPPLPCAPFVCAELVPDPPLGVPPACPLDPPLCEPPDGPPGSCAPEPCA